MTRVHTAPRHKVATASALAHIAQRRLEADRRLYMAGAVCGLVFGFLLGLVVGLVL